MKNYLLPFVAILLFLSSCDINKKDSSEFKEIDVFVPDSLKAKSNEDKSIYKGKVYDPKDSSRWVKFNITTNKKGTKFHSFKILTDQKPMGVKGNDGSVVYMSGADFIDQAMKCFTGSDNDIVVCISRLILKAFADCHQSRSETDCWMYGTN